MNLTPFLNAIAQSGLTPPDNLRDDSEFQDWAGRPDKPHKKSSWYIFDGECVTWGDRALGGKLGSFRLSDGPNQTPEQVQATLEARRQRQATLERERAQKAADGAAKAQQIYASATDCTEHRYLERKGIPAPKGLKLASDGRLIVPVYGSDDKLISVQYIAVDGGKRFLAGAIVKGGWFAIGETADPAVVAVAEGMATAASIHAATEWPCYVGFSCGGLKAAAETAKRHHPNAHIVMCGDRGNGSKHARDAALAIGGMCAIPKLSNGTDFNDLATSDCLEAVREQLQAALSQQSWMSKILEWFAPTKKAKIPRQTVTLQREGEIYLRNKRFEVWANHRYVLANDEPGTGKSYAAGQLSPELLGVSRLVYVSNDHRNTTVETLSDWADLESRHNGLIRDSHGKLRRATDTTQTRATDANCSRADLFDTARAKGIEDTEEICLSCPMLPACQNGTGRGYGLRWERRQALQHSKFRAHPDNLPREWDWSDTALLLDEPGMIAFTERLTVSLADIGAAMGEASKHDINLMHHLIELYTLVSGDLPRWGLSFTEVRERLEQPPAVKLPEVNPLTGIFEQSDRVLAADNDLDRDHRRTLNRALAREAGQTMPQLLKAMANLPKQWLGRYLSAWQGEASLSVTSAGLTITWRKAALSTALQQAARVILLDATMNRQQAALVLGCDPESIYVCRTADKATPNLTIQQVPDFGRMGLQRGNDQLRRLQALKDAYPAAAFIDFKRFADDGGLVHFRDSRGINGLYEQGTRELFIVGAPTPNLVQVRLEFEALGGNPEQFQSYLNGVIAATLVQEIGRLRANRRPDESLRVVLLTDVALDVGYSIEHINSGELCPEAAPKGERTRYKVIQAAQVALECTGVMPTQAELARMLNLTQQAVSKCLKAFTGGWRGFREIVQLLLKETTYKKSCEPSNEVEVNYLSALSKLPPDVEIAQELGCLLQEWGTEKLANVLNSLPSRYRQQLLSSCLTTISNRLVSHNRECHSDSDISTLGL
ncbi:MAG: hypothetical protein EA367_15835 [Leptolyngbya sp. DLM2.Bin15]|nr:MAG: hypothetical protein EA367_15835 [Leptolyngbya sp. DLM2.Bin15]